MYSLSFDTLHVFENKPNAVQNSTTKSYTIKVLEHTHTPKHIIIIQIIHVVVFNERTPTPQKRNKSVRCALNYSQLKISDHQN